MKGSIITKMVSDLYCDMLFIADTSAFGHFIHSYDQENKRVCLFVNCLLYLWIMEINRNEHFLCKIDISLAQKIEYRLSWA